MEAIPSVYSDQLMPSLIRDPQVMATCLATISDVLIASQHSPLMRTISKLKSKHLYHLPNLHPTQCFCKNVSWHSICSKMSHIDLSLVHFISEPIEAKV